MRSKCPKCGASMVVKKNNNGNEFLGCSKYPRCKGSLSLPNTKSPQSITQNIEEAEK